MTEVVQSAIVVASISILWRSTLNKKPWLREKLQGKFPVFLGTALTCGLCFTYWTAFLFVLAYRPLPYDFFGFNSFSNPAARWSSYFFLSWMTVGTCAVFIRFAFALLQEGVNRMNEVNGNSHHHHHTHA